MTNTHTKISSARVIKLLGVASTAILLAACQTTGSSTTELRSTHGTVEEDLNTNIVAPKKTAISYDKDGNGTVSIKRDGKTYSFTKANLVSGSKDHYVKDVNGVEVQLKNYSTVFSKYDDHDTKDVQLWYFGEWNKGKDVYSSGYVDFGNKTETMPTTLSASYAGRVQGYSVNKDTSGGQAYINGAINLNANFNTNTQSITGNINNIEAIDANFGDVSKFPDIAITNGKIANGGFTGQLSHNGTDVVSSSLNGSFYGKDAAEVGGIGQIETANTHTTFGFTGSKK